MDTSNNIEIMNAIPEYIDREAPLSRRDFLRRAGMLLLSAGAMSAAPGLVHAAAYWDQPRELSLYRPDTGERVKEVYYAAGAIHKEGYFAVCRLLRDIHDNAAVQMSPRLLDILFGLQGWLKAYDLPTQLWVTSGYRSQETNRKLREAGIPAAVASRHCRGAAADITVPRVSATTLAKMAKELGGGGVGMYPAKKFIHVDDGPIRTWAA